MAKKMTFLEKQRRQHIEMMEGSERKTLERFVKLNSGRVTGVDWKKLVQHHASFRDISSEGVIDKTWNDILWYLNYKNVLCFEHDGFYPIVRGGDASPYDDGSTVHHFRREVDARKYMEAEFPNTPVSLRKVI